MNRETNKIGPAARRAWSLLAALLGFEPTPETARAAGPNPDSKEWINLTPPDRLPYVEEEG